MDTAEAPMEVQQTEENQIDSQENTLKKGESPSTECQKLDSQEAISVKAEENKAETTNPKNDEPDLQNTKENVLENDEKSKSAEDVIAEDYIDETTTENSLNRKEVKVDDQTSAEVTTENTLDNKEVKIDDQNGDKSLLTVNPEHEDVAMDTEILSNIEVMNDTATAVNSVSTKNCDIQIISNECIKPPSNLPLVAGNSLGLSLLASEYATSDSEQDSNSSDGDDDDDDSEDDDSDSDASSTHTVPRNDADNLEAIAEEIELVTNPTSYRDQVVEVDSDTSSDSSDVEIISQCTNNPEPIEIDDNNDLDDDDDDDDDGGKNKKGKNKKQSGPIRVKGELLLEDLPPIEDLYITVPETECEEIGKIQTIVDQLVLVQSIPNTILLDLDTVLFLEKGSKVLGKVFDVLGQVAEPMYCIRFNSNQQIKDKNIEIGQTVYVAPRTEHTQFIILTKLMKIRGSDASWENDVEPPPSHLDYSDDEEERNARRAHRNRNKNTDGNNDNDDDVESSIPDDVSIHSDSSMLRNNSRRKRRFNQQRNRNYANNSQRSNYNSNQGQFNQGFNNYNQSPNQRYNQNYSGANGYNSNNGSYFDRNAPVPPAGPSSYYNSSYNSWHGNFNPYNQYNGGNYPNYQMPSQNVGMPPYMPPPSGYMQQPLFPPGQGGYRHPPPS